MRVYKDGGRIIFSLTFSSSMVDIDAVTFFPSSCTFLAPCLTASTVSSICSCLMKVCSLMGERMLGFLTREEEEDDSGLIMPWGFWCFL